MYTIVEIQNPKEMGECFRVRENVPHIPGVRAPEWRSHVLRELDRKNNPAYRSATLRLFVRRKGMSPVARVSLVLPHDGRTTGGRATFGYVECAQDEEAFRVLMRHIEDLTAGEGITTLEGPFSWLPASPWSSSEVRQSAAWHFHR